jgi:hypothetical protein
VSFYLEPFRFLHVDQSTNPSSLSKYVPTNVTSQTILAVYTYQPRNLFVSYGLAILFSVLSVGVGVYSFHRNGASYDASFSSISVAMQNVEVSHNSDW